MSKELVTSGTAEEIEAITDKLLKDLKITEPPVSLEAVRDRIKVDLAYYSTAEASTFGNFLHSLRVKTHELLKKCERLEDAWKNKTLRGFWSPDQNRILVDESLHDRKQRWVETHEIVHSLIPHHQAYTLGDSKWTLSQSCQVQIEAEANYGTGRLLYLGDQYRERLLASELTLSHVRALGPAFGNSELSSLWRAVETLDIPACGMWSVHPWCTKKPEAERIEHFMRSTMFCNQFASVEAYYVYRKLTKVVGRLGIGPLGKAEVVLDDIAGNSHKFHFECFGNKYGVMTLGYHTTQNAVRVAVK